MLESGYEQRILGPSAPNCSRMAPQGAQDTMLLCPEVTKQRGGAGHSLLTPPILLPALCWQVDL